MNYLDIAHYSLVAIAGAYLSVMVATNKHNVNTHASKIDRAFVTIVFAGIAAESLVELTKV